MAGRGRSLVLLSNLDFVCNEWHLQCSLVKVGLGDPRMESAPCESPLLKAYHLSVEDLDYNFVEKCHDVALVIKVLRILRSVVPVTCEGNLFDVFGVW